MQSDRGSARGRAARAARVAVPSIDAPVEDAPVTNAPVNNLPVGNQQATNPGNFPGGVDYGSVRSDNEFEFDFISASQTALLFPTSLVNLDLL